MRRRLQLRPIYWVQRVRLHRETAPLLRLPAITAQKEVGSMKHLFHRKAEAWLILLAARILSGRNVHRAAVVSRQDNNDMGYMAEKLEAIAQRISKGYP